MMASPPRITPDLGEALLTGSRWKTISSPGRTEAMAIMGGELMIGSSTDFCKNGLYELHVRLEQTGRSLSSPLVCQLTLPEYLLQLTSPFGFDVDNMQPDPMK